MWLAYAAGIAQGANNGDAAASLFGILSRLQPVEVANEAPDPAIANWYAEDIVPEEPLSEESEIQAFYEAGGTPPPPVNAQGNFGAGPPGPSLR